MKSPAQTEKDSIIASQEYLMRKVAQNECDIEVHRTTINRIVDEFRKIRIVLEFLIGHTETEKLLGKLPQEFNSKIGRKSVTHPRIAKVVP